MQFLKVALRATTDIGRLNDKPPVDNHEAKDAKSRWWQAYTLLLEIRRAARDAGQLGPKDSSEGAIVQGWMKALTTGSGVDCDEESSTSSDECSQSSPDPFDPATSKNVESHPRASALAPLAGHTLRHDGNASNPSNCSNPAAAITLNVPPVESPDDASQVMSPCDVLTSEPARSSASAPHSTAPQKEKPQNNCPCRPPSAAACTS